MQNVRLQLSNPLTLVQSPNIDSTLNQQQLQITTNQHKSTSQDPIIELIPSDIGIHDQNTRIIADLSSQDLQNDYENIALQVLSKTREINSGSKAKPKPLITLRKEESEPVITTIQLQNQRLSPVPMQQNNGKKLLNLPISKYNERPESAISMDSFRPNRKGCQTQNPYDVSANVVLHEIENQVRQLISEMVKPIVEKQQTQQYDITQMIKKHLFTSTQLQELENKVRRQQTDFVIQTFKKEMSELKYQIEDQEKHTNNRISSTQNTITQVYAKIELVEDQNQQLLRYIQSKTDETIKFQTLTESFRERILEKFRIISEDLCEKVRKVENSHKDLQNSLKNYEKDSQNINSHYTKIVSTFEQTQAHINELHNDISLARRVTTFDERVAILEVQMSRIGDGEKKKKKKKEKLIDNPLDKYLKKDDAFELVSRMQVDLVKELFNLEKHKVGQMATISNQKYESEVQTLMNLADWQIKLAGIQKPFKYFTKNSETALEQDTNLLQRAKFKLHLKAKRKGQVFQRRHSVPKLQEKSCEPDQILDKDYKRLLKFMEKVKSQHQKNELKRSRSIKVVNHKKLNELSFEDDVIQMLDDIELQSSSSSVSGRSVQKKVEKQSQKEMLPVYKVKEEAKESDTESLEQREVLQIKKKKTGQIGRKHTFINKDSDQNLIQSSNSFNFQGSDAFSELEKRLISLIEQNMKSMNDGKPYRMKTNFTGTKSPFRSISNSGSHVSPTDSMASIPDIQYVIPKRITVRKNSSSESSDSDTQSEDSSEEEKTQHLNYRLQKLEKRFKLVAMADDVRKKFQIFEEQFPPQFLKQSLQQAKDFFKSSSKKQNKKLKESISDYTKRLLTQLKIQIEVIIDENKKTAKDDLQYFADQRMPFAINRLREEIVKEIKIQQQLQSQLTSDTKTKIGNLQQILDAFEMQVEVVLKKFKRVQGDWLSQHEQLEKQSAALKIQGNEIQQHNDANTRIISTLVELQYMRQSLDLQDEYDRQKTYLFGLGDTSLTADDILGKNDKASIQYNQLAIKLKEDCIVCCDNKDIKNRNKILSAFKTACLNYQSSEVLFRGRKFTRKTMLELHRDLLDQEWRQMLMRQPYDGFISSKEHTGMDETVIEMFYKQLDSKLDSHKIMISEKRQIQKTAHEQMRPLSLPKLETENSTTLESNNQMTLSIQKLKNQTRKKPHAYTGYSQYRAETVNELASDNLVQRFLQSKMSVESQFKFNTKHNDSIMSTEEQATKNEQSHRAMTQLSVHNDTNLRKNSEMDRQLISQHTQSPTRYLTPLTQSTRNIRNKLNQSQENFNPIQVESYILTQLQRAYMC